MNRRDTKEVDFHYADDHWWRNLRLEQSCSFSGEWTNVRTTTPPLLFDLIDDRMKQGPFEFSDELTFDSQSHLALIPANLLSKSDLMQTLRDQLRLPDYFGSNWDALSDCLRDFSWVESGEVILVHRDLPELPRGDLVHYLSVLAEAIESWRSTGESRFRVVFPAGAMNRVATVLSL